MSKRGPGEVTNKERGASAGGEPHPERAEPLLVREEPRPQPQEGLNGDESAKEFDYLCLRSPSFSHHQYLSPSLRKDCNLESAILGIFLRISSLRGQILKKPNSFIYIDLVFW